MRLRNHIDPIRRKSIVIDVIRDKHYHFDFYIIKYNNNHQDSDIIIALKKN